MTYDSAQLDFLYPLVCESRSVLAGFVPDTCRGCGAPIVRHKDWPAWVHFICVWCCVGHDKRPQKKGEVLA